MVNTKTPFADLIAANISSPVMAETLIAPAILPETAVAAGVLVGVANDTLNQIVDGAASAGDIWTLSNPVTGEGSYQPNAGAGSVYEHIEPGIAVPGSGVVLQVFTITHNQNAYPVDVQVLGQRASGEYVLIPDAFFDSGVWSQWSTDKALTGIDNTVNTYNIAIGAINNGDFNTPTTNIKVRLHFA